MNKREIEKQALNSLNTYFKDNPDKVLNDFERKPLDKEDITKIVNEEIQAQEKKVESLEVLRKNIAIEAEESLEKVLGKRITSKKSPNKLTVDEMAVKLQEEKTHQIETANKLKTAKLRKYHLLMPLTNNLNWK